jgi:hypothetical protein
MSLVTWSNEQRRISSVHSFIAFEKSTTSLKNCIEMNDKTTDISQAAGSDDL